MRPIFKSCTNERCKGIAYDATADANTNNLGTPVGEHARVTMNTLADVEDWWNGLIPNNVDASFDAWYGQHLVNLDWLEIPTFSED